MMKRTISIMAISTLLVGCTARQATIAGGTAVAFGGSLFAAQPDSAPEATCQGAPMK